MDRVDGSLIVRLLQHMEPIYPNRELVVLYLINQIK